VWLSPSFLSLINSRLKCNEKEATNLSKWQPLFWHSILEIYGQANEILSWKQLVEILPQPWQPGKNTKLSFKITSN
jgi:hypothetical protein